MHRELPFRFMKLRRSFHSNFTLALYRAIINRECKMLQFKGAVGRSQQPWRPTQRGRLPALVQPCDVTDFYGGIFMCLEAS